MIAQSLPNKARSSQVIERDYLSHSAVSTYQQCPLRYYFRYVEGMAEPFISSSLAFGGALHSALEFHFQELLEGNEPPDHEMLRAEFWKEWEFRTDAVAVQFAQGETVDTIVSAADRMLAAFQAAELSRPSGRILGVEEELREALIPGLPEILGRIDLIVETDEAVRIIDFKTARTRWSAEQAERSGEQLLLYAELARDLRPGKPLVLQFAVLTKTAKPTVELFAVKRDEQRIARTKRIVERVWKAIEGKHFFPAPSAMNCPGCPFRRECDAWAG